MLADLWNVDESEHYMGTSTVGSSEACMLGGMAMKFRWRSAALKNGLDIHAKNQTWLFLQAIKFVGKSSVCTGILSYVKYR